MNVIEIAVEIPKPLLSRNIAGIGMSDSPLANGRRGISGVLKDLRGRGLINRVSLIAIGSLAAVPRMQSRHQHAARRRADSAAGVELREADPLRSQAVD